MHEGENMQPDLKSNPISQHCAMSRLPLPSIVVHALGDVQE